MTLQRFGLLILIVAAVVATPACGAIVGIFKAGMGVGIFLAVMVVGLVLFVVSKARA
jgi:hypothetical protein